MRFIMSAFLNDSIEKIKALSYHSIILKLITAFCTVSLVTTLVTPYSFTSEEYFQAVPFGIYIAAVAVLFLFLCFFINSRLDGYLLLTVLTGLFFITNLSEGSIYFALISTLVTGGFIFFLGDRLSFVSLSKKATIILCAVFGIFLAVFVGGITIIKYMDYRSMNFDFGIFAQMYHYMAKTLVPYTTCERDMLLSHFAVHFSPILYVALPFYLLFPHPATLLAVQGLVVGSGVIPLYKLCKHFQLSNKKTAAVVFIYALHPSVIANNFYYFHENCFLTVLLLWTFYFMEKKKNPAAFLFALLTMMVKEDAAVFILFFGLYLIFSNKDKYKGLFLSLMACFYFCLVMALMTMFGNGVMSYRYENFIFDEGGSLFSVILNIIKNPAYLLQQILTADKLEFLIQMLLPMALLPFAIKKPARIILLLPMVLLNLMSNYTYQYDISFQYTYGPLAFLFYLMILNVRDLKPIYAKKLLLSSVCASLIIFAAFNVRKLSAIESFQNNQERNRIITQTLDSIPKDKSIAATTYFVPSLWNREEVYEIRYTDEITDYVVFDLRGSTADYYTYLAEHPEYETTVYEPNIIAVLQHASAEP